MVDYTSLASTAKRLIEKNGRALTFTKFSQAPADPAKPHRARNPASDQTVTPTGVVVPFARDQINGSNIMAEDKLVMVAQTSVPGTELEFFDQVTDDGEDYDIVMVDKVDPGDTPVMYMIQVRR